MGQALERVALIEVLDRDGSVRQSASVNAWPMHVGRALDNDLVLDDAHAAAHHFSVELDEQGQPVVRAGDSVNGLRVAARPVRSGEQVPVGDEPLLLQVGRTALRLRLASHALAPEQPLASVRVLTQGLRTLLALALAVAAVLVFGTWLDSDPDLFVKTLATQSISAVAALLGWAGAWTLLSKLFTHQGHFGWHLRVLLLAVLAWELALAACALAAFALSWPWLTDYSFVGVYVIVGAMLYFHLQAVEPQHPRRTRALAVTSALVGIGLSLWFNWQANDSLGSELYMNHLFPPAWRLAKPVDTPRFLEGVAAMQATLDRKAKQDDSD